MLTRSACAFGVPSHLLPLPSTGCLVDKRACPWILENFAVSCMLCHLGLSPCTQTSQSLTVRSESRSVTLWCICFAHSFLCLDPANIIPSFNTECPRKQQRATRRSWRPSRCWLPLLASSVRLACSPSSRCGAMHVYSILEHTVSEDSPLLARAQTLVRARSMSRTCKRARSASCMHACVPEWSKHSTWHVHG